MLTVFFSYLSVRSVLLLTDKNSLEAILNTNDNNNKKNMHVFGAISMVQP